MVKLGLEEEQIWVRERWNRESLRSDKNYNNMMKQAQRVKVLPLTLWGGPDLCQVHSPVLYCPNPGLSERDTFMKNLLNAQFWPKVVENGQRSMWYRKARYT